MRMRLQIFVNDLIIFSCVFFIILISNYTYEIYRFESKFKNKDLIEQDQKQFGDIVLKPEFICGIIPEYQIGILESRMVDCDNFKWPWDVIIETKMNNRYLGYVISQKLIFSYSDQRYNDVKEAVRIFHFTKEYLVEKIHEKEYFVIIELKKLINFNKFYMPICIQNLNEKLTNLKTFSWNFDESSRSLTNHPDKMFACEIQEKLNSSDWFFFRVKISNLVYENYRCHNQS
ncbi:hypothetical protein BpHYR1_023214, partial [Brachionus plicatilis]